LSLDMDGVSSSSQSSLPSPSNGRISAPYDDTRKSKKKFVPWEPHKAACGEEKQSSEVPPIIPPLYPYQLTNPSDRSFVFDGLPLVDGRKERMKKCQSEVEEELREEIERMEGRLREETKKTEELRRVLMATMENDVVEYVMSMTHDKTKLAAMIDEYSQKLASDSDRVDGLSIERDIWRSKYVAMSVRAHEEGTRAERALNVALAAQKLLSEIIPLVPPPFSTRALDLSTRPLSHLFSRSPCDERICARDPIYSNLTITCCSKCSGREIYLL
ncbi:hypothetical protein PFISCL1PPCAC_10374, partial [Pristionchus fissidentatus]